MVILRREAVPTVPVLTLSKPAGLATPVIINPEVLASQTIRTITPARQAIRAALVLLRRNRKGRPQKFALADKNQELATNVKAAVVCILEKIMTKQPAVMCLMVNVKTIAEEQFTNV